MQRIHRSVFLIAAGGLLLVGAALFWPQPVAAQCGSQASSCRNCHEVQAQDPVNAEGEWHVAHAFGDFCEFCHAGNVQATDKDAAHEGLVEPLADVQTGCASCHPADYGELAQGYAVALGVTIDASASGGGDLPSGGAPAGDAPADVEPAQPEPAAVSIQQPGVVDYNARYEAAQGRAPINWGNVILAAMLAAVVGGGGAFVAWNERRLRHGPALQLAVAAALPAAAPAGPTAGLAPAQRISPAQAPPSAEWASLRPEVAELLPALQALEPRALKALKKILADPAGGGELLATLARIDPALIEEVRRLDRREINMLLALAQE